MKYVWHTLGWIGAVLSGLLTVSMLLLRNWLQALVLLLVLLLCLPPISTILRKRFNVSLHPLLRAALMGGLLAVFVRQLLGTKATSIYSSPEVEAQLLKIYDEKMAAWPVPYEDVYLDTSYGKVHVIVSGPQDAPPLLLLHASGVAGWSWKANVAELSARYRTYAIDLIGDAGKSSYTSLDHVMQSGEDQADLSVEITNQLGVAKAYVVGASEGGFIGSNYARYYPERVAKLALLGPMGYAGATQTIVRITFAAFFPLKPVHDATFSWAFSDSAAVKAEFSEWFPLYMRSVAPVKVAPLPLAPEERRSITVPVLFVFGERDHLVGDPEMARRLVQDVPDARVEIVDARHLMAAEQPQQVNALLMEFLAEGTDRL